MSALVTLAHNTAVPYARTAMKCQHQDPDCWAPTLSEDVESPRPLSTMTCWIGSIHWPDWMMP
eukprot:12631670-Prorocentrum_lima.AAC.1